MNFRIFAATLSLARAIEPTKVEAEAKRDPGRDEIVVLVADRAGELGLMNVSPEVSVDLDELALAQRSLQALAYIAIPVAAMTFQAGLESAIHALSHTQAAYTEFDEDPTVTAFTKRLIADSDSLPVNDLSVDTEGSKWGLYIDPAKLTITVHMIDESVGDYARGILAFVMKAKTSEQLRLTVRVIEDVRALEKIRAKERESLRGFMGGFAIHIVDPFGPTSGAGHRHGHEAAPAV